MAILEVVPFSDEHLSAAGRLLAARHERQRQAEPTLAPAYEDPATHRGPPPSATASSPAI
jgi:hypothetical protein